MPRLWLFNPGHEEALRVPQGQNYTPPRIIQQMMRDLYPLMALLAEPEDYIARLASPTALEIYDSSLRRITRPDLLPPLRLTPWALEPHLIRRAFALAQRLGLSLHLPSVSPEYLRLSHRDAVVPLLRSLSPRFGFPLDLIPHWFYPQHTPAETARAIRLHLARQSERPLVAKLPFTSSGRGVFPLSLPLGEPQLLSLANACHRAGGISFEPWLEVLDNWAILYHADGSNVRYAALSRFSTDSASRTAYTGNILAPQTELRRQLAEHAGGAPALDRLIAAHQAFLAEQLAGNYCGCIGIDLFVYRDESGRVCLHPAVEINLRYTMGYLAARAYERYASGGQTGRFVLEPRGAASPLPATEQRVELTPPEGAFAAALLLPR